MKEIPAQSGRQLMLRPNRALRIMMYLSLFASSASLFLPPMPPIPQLVLTCLTIGGWISLFVYRRHRAKAQLDINSRARDFIEGAYVLYLRPFVTSGMLPVPCLLPRKTDRCLIGWNWDLEFALSLAVRPPCRLVAVGNTAKAVGAAKVVVEDDGWQSLVKSLMDGAQAIVIVPSDRSGTLWEMLEIFNGGRADKTIFVMPPTTIWQRAKRLFAPWRYGIAAHWRGAKAELAKFGIDLPEYRSQGALLLANGRRLELFDTNGFDPGYVGEFISRSTTARSAALFDKTKQEIKKTSSRHPAGRPASDYVVFFSPTLAIKMIVVALFIRTFLYQPYLIPSSSMNDTILVGDYLLVSKFSYGYTHYSLPFSPPLFSGRVWSRPPTRGDVVVFRLPSDDRIEFMQRVVGLPGDRIRVIRGALHINDVAVRRERIEDFVEPGADGRPIRVKRWRETLPNGVSHTTLDLTDNGLLDNTPEYVVPAGHYFMMGDNRDNSADSRLLKRTGYVPFENLVGRAEIIFSSIEPSADTSQFWNWPTRMRWHRVFSAVR